MGHCRWVASVLLICTVIAGVAGQGQDVKPPGTGRDPVGKPDDQFDMYGDDYSLSAEAYSTGALGASSAGTQPTSAAYHADYDDDYTMPNPKDQLEEECADQPDGTPLNGTDVCEVRIRGADVKVALLAGGVDGLYKPVACNDGRPMYVRQGSPPQEDRVLWWSNRFADWDVSNGTKPVKDDVLLYGGGSGDLRPQHVSQWHIATEFQVNNTSSNDYTPINITVVCASLVQVEVGQGSTVVSGGSRDGQHQESNTTSTSSSSSGSNSDTSSNSSGSNNDTSSNSTGSNSDTSSNSTGSSSGSGETSGAGQDAAGGFKGQQQGEGQLQPRGTGSGTDRQQQAGAGSVTDAKTAAEHVKPVADGASNGTDPGTEVQAEGGGSSSSSSSSDNPVAQTQETGGSLDAQAAAPTDREEGKGGKESLDESASGDRQGNPSMVQQRGSEAGASTDDVEGGNDSGAPAGQEEQPPLQWDDEGFTDEDAPDTSTRGLQGPLLSDEEMEQQYSLVYKRAQQAAVSKSSTNAVLVGFFMMAAVGIAVGMPLIYAKHQRNRAGAAEGSERSVYIALSQAVRGRRRARE